MKAPRFKDGDLVHVHNEPEDQIFEICHVVESRNEGKSHRYYYKDMETGRVHSGIGGFYEGVFTMCTDADIGG